MKITIEWTYATPKKLKSLFKSEELTVQHALLLLEDIEKTGRVKQIELYDENGSTWTKKELSKWLKQSDTEISDVVAYFDGGFDLETHLSGVGAVIYYQQNKKQFRNRYNARLEELESNNEAEYAAFYFLVQQLELLEITNCEVTFKGDSQVVINQLSGEWPCYDESFNKWLDRIEKRLKALRIKPIYEAVGRKENTEADRLAEQALQGTPIESHMEIN